MTRTYLLAVMAIAIAAITGPASAGIILPGIQGTVFQDADLSGSPSGGEGVAGASLRLYQDNGNGVFEPGAGDTQIGPDYVTSGDGSYAFQNLDPNANYFVQRAALNVGGNALPAAVSALLSPGQVQLLIDAFENNQGIKANPMTPMATSTYNDPMSNVLGHERDMYVHLLGGIGEVELRSNAFGVSVLQYDTASGVVGEAIVTWDGIDMSASPVPSLGLGDLDLTNGGTSEGILFRLGVDTTGSSEKLRIRLFDDSTTEYSEAAIGIPMTDGTASAMAYLPFSDLIGPVLPSKVNAIQLILGAGAKSVDAQVDFLGTIGPVRQDFEVVPEPSTLALLLIACCGLIARARRN